MARAYIVLGLFMIRESCQIINLKEADKYERNRCKLSQWQN